MLPVEGQDLLRIAVLSGMLGFAAFCISYGMFIWRKRNGGGTKPRSPSIRIAQMLAGIGCLGIGISWALNEFQERTGIAEGNDLFVVHARPESAWRQITAADTISEGDVVAEFLSPGDRTRLAGVEMQQAQARAKRDAIQNRALQFDQSLLQEQSHLRSELIQLKGFSFDLLKSRYDIERGRTDLSTSWTREESQIDQNIHLAGREATKAASHRTLTQRALERGQALQKRRFIPEQEVDARTAADKVAELDIKEQKDSVSELYNRRKALEGRFSASDSFYAQQVSEISKDSADIQASLQTVESRLKEVDETLRQDRERAVLSRSKEVEAVDYDISILAAEKTRLTEAVCRATIKVRARDNQDERVFRGLR